MKQIVVGLFLLLSAASLAPLPASFEADQKKYPRVADVYNRKEELFKMKCRAKEIPENFGDLLIRVFKQEQTVELWVQKPDGNYTKFADYKIYAWSGLLGPKRTQGDAQVPEGYYYINEFNPQSNYHLSLRINYPNASDKALSRAVHRGGDIYIHGGSASAGCIAVSDYYIEDIYMAAVKARNQGQEKIPVQIFPFRMTRINMTYFSKVQSLRKNLPLWNSMVEGYRYFEQHHHPSDVAVGADGYYIFPDAISYKK